MDLHDLRPPITEDDFAEVPTGAQLIKRMMAASPEELVQAVGWNLPRTDQEREMMVIGYLIGRGEGHKVCVPLWFENLLKDRQRGARRRYNNIEGFRAEKAFKEALAATLPSTEQ